MLRCWCVEVIRFAKQNTTTRQHNNTTTRQHDNTTNMNINLNGKNALVCGSSQGLGEAIAHELAGLGASVMLTARNEAKLQKVRAALPSPNGQQHQYFVSDFTNSEDLKSKIEALVKKQNIHILINNTGGPASGPVLTANVQDFLQAFHNHVVCNQILVQATVDGMKADRYGRIINIISTSVKQPIPDLGVSNTTRGAVANWAKTMSNELAPYGITVNNLLPGSTKTDRLTYIIEAQATKHGLSAEANKENWLKAIPMQRFAEPEEIAAAVAFLAAPAASYITGVNLPVDGGKTRSL